MSDEPEKPRKQTWQEAGLPCAKLEIERKFRLKGIWHQFKHVDLKREIAAARDVGGTNAVNRGWKAALESLPIYLEVARAELDAENNLEPDPFEVEAEQIALLQERTRQNPQKPSDDFLWAWTHQHFPVTIDDAPTVGAWSIYQFAREDPAAFRKEGMKVAIDELNKSSGGEKHDGRESLQLIEQLRAEARAKREKENAA